MRKRSLVTCNECYFRHAGLCALVGDTPCPTFRECRRGALTPPKQAPLIPRPPLAAHAATA